MRRFFFIAKNNIKKQKGDMITFSILSFVAAFLIFVSASFLVDGIKVVDEAKEKVNGFDIMYIIPKDRFSESKLEELIRGNENIKEYEVTEANDALTSKYRKKGQKDWTDHPFTLMSYDQEISIEKCSVDTQGMRENDIVLPVSLSLSFSKGDIIEIKVGDNIYEFKVADFSEDPIFCSPMNMGRYLVFVSRKMYEEIAFENKANSSIFNMHKIQLTAKAIKEHAEMDEIGNKIFNEHRDWASDYQLSHGVPVSQIDNNLPYDMMSMANMILPDMFIAIILLFAVIIFVISIVIINFSIKNFIMNNMRNTAIMEAAGYTPKEMILILLCQLVMLALCGSVAGVIMGMLSIGKIGVIMLMLLGLAWNRPVNILVGIVVVVGICAVIAGMTFIMGGDYKKISVLEALRGGINAHNFKKNHFPFEKYPFPVPVILSLKETFGKFKSQMGIVFIMMILSLSCAVALGFSDTFASSNEALLDVSGFPMYGAECEGDKTMIERVESMETVKSAFGESWNSLSYTSARVKTPQTMTSVGITDFEKRVCGSLVEGRWPIYENEIVFGGNAAKRLKVGVGDAVTVKNGSAEENYIVTGICQLINNMGNMAFMPEEGMKKVIHIDTYNICVNFKDKVSYEEFETEFKEIFPDADVADYEKESGAVTGVVMLGMKATAYFIMILTIFICVFVEALVVRTQITKSWRELGVSKALGYTSNQLILQTMLTNLPAIILGITVGIILSKMTGPKAAGLMFAMFGFRKVSFTIFPVSYIITVIIILLSALLTAALLGRRIKGLEPVKMITEE